MSLQLPSTVTDSTFLWMPSNQKVMEDDKEWEKCGRWMLLYPQNDVYWADKAWTDLQVLVSNGSLLQLKASTAAFKKEGLIQCYTRSPGQDEARKAAEAIRRVVHYEFMMYYKSNKTTKEGIASRYGHRNFSQYMHTFHGHFYVKEDIYRWKFVDTQNKSVIGERKPGVSNAAKIALGLQSLPSRGIAIDLDRFSEIDHTLPTAAQITSSGYLELKCNLRKEEDGLTEADCVWMVVKSLYDSGDFIRIKYKETAKAAEIRCFVTDYTDSLNLCNICKHIFGTARFPSIIYFYIQTSANLKYVFTPQGELYEEQEQEYPSRKFILKFETDSLDV